MKNLSLNIIFIFLNFNSSFGYFQQHVDYQIDAKLIPSLNRIESIEEMVYYNNSPDTLNFIYFNLYLNHFKESINHQSVQNLGYIEIISIRNYQNDYLIYEITGTILKLELNEKLLPNDSIFLKIRFNSILPKSAERLGSYGDHYDVGNWFPVPAVYDHLGWHAHQHIEGEFYQEWGDFKVNITVPRGYVVGATGILLNPAVFPDSVEFPERKLNYDYLREEDTITYKFEALQVHDFAWVANPEFVLIKIQVDQTQLNYLVFPYRYEDWQKQFDIGVQTVRLFSEKIGVYPYPSLTIVDGYIKAGGIEYPNLVIINDRIYDSESLSATIIHEIAHQWFYGILANNQARYGWMDEGFATFFENLGMQEILKAKKIFIESPTGFWGKYMGFWDDVQQKDRQVYFEYIRKGKEEPINQHFDWFQNDPYILYYQKMSLVISQLRLVLGDSIFWKGIHAYYQKWKFKHPYPDDLFAVFEKVGGQDLSWFFDEWLNTTWHCDYGIKAVKGRWVETSNGRKYAAQIHFHRYKPIVMPVDFSIELADDSIIENRIPVGMIKNQIEESFSTIPKWPFLENDYTLSIETKTNINSVKLNPYNELLDVNPFNNDSKKFPKIHWYWMNRQYFLPHTDGYTATVFPNIFYNDIDGLQAGIKTRGNYIYPDYNHRLDFLMGLKSFMPEIDFVFEHPIYSIHPNLHFMTWLYNIAGRRGVGIWFQHNLLNKGPEVNFTLGWQFRNIYNTDYFPYPVSNVDLSFLELKLKMSNWKKGYMPLGWEAQINTESSFIGSNYNYQNWQFTAIFRIPFILKQKLTGYIFTGGIFGEIPLQKGFRLGGASVYSLINNPYLRTRGSFPSDWWQEGNVFQEGNGNLRSLAGDWSIVKPYLTSGSLSLTLGNPVNYTMLYIPYLSDVIISLYTSWALPGNIFGDFPKGYGEAGFSISLTRLLFILNYLDIDQIHFDFPLWINENIDQSSVKFRWVIRLDIRKFY